MIHEEFQENRKTYKNDIALINLDEQIHFDENIQRINIPLGDGDFGESVFATGLGFRDENKEVRHLVFTFEKQYLF